ncbi:hypothetical protein G419_09956 [Rhodococcus triatomae BKS 15-14]|nr:hypothetical protein G419_09956 [Rhodococcus triatomae BKS 15-14]
MTARSMVAVHLTESATWARSGDRTVERPAGVALSSGHVAVAVDRATAASDEVFEPAPIRFVGDDVLVLGSTAVDVADLLEEVLADALVAVGAATPVDRLVVTCPTSWGTRRRRVLVAVGRRVAREVRVMPVAEAAAPETNSDDTHRFGVFFEIGMLASEATATFGGAVSVDAIGAMDLISRPESVSELVESVQRALPDVPEWVAVVGVLPPPVVDALAREVRRRWDADVAVREVSERDLLDSAYGWGSLQAGPSGSDRERHSVRPNDRRLVGSVVAVGVLALAAVAAWPVFTALRGSDDGAQVVSETPIVAGVTGAVDPAADPPAAMPGRVATGRAAVDVPAGWHPRAASDGSDRVELVRDDSRPARILLVQKDLRDGADLDAVAVTLAGQIAERSDTFGPIEHVEFDGRPALSYRETPDGESHVAWWVFVADGLQVSVGCQAPRTDPDSVEPACGDVARSVTVAVS